MIRRDSTDLGQGAIRPTIGSWFFSLDLLFGYESYPLCFNGWGSYLSGCQCGARASRGLRGHFIPSGTATEAVSQHPTMLALIYEAIPPAQAGRDH
jgi:hypothetical protein